MKNIKKFFVVALFVFVGFDFGVFAKDLKVSDVAPDFTIKVQDGSEFSLSAQKGKPVLLHFWATWCPPCIRELPEMQKLSDDLAESKLEFIAVCISDSEANKAAFMKKNNYTFPCALDELGDIVASKYNVSGIPTSILIGADGKILKINVGMMSAKQLEAFVKDVK